MRRRVTAIAATVLVAGSFLFVGQASAQVPVDPSVLAEAECAPDGSTQGIVFTFINGNVTAVTITGATASGTLLTASVPLTFDPADLLPSATATADIAVPGTAAGNLDVSVDWVGDNESQGTATASFDVTACVGSTDTTAAVTTSTAAPARPAAATATFTG